jgi:4'-phosphopantetheinyl transferase
MDAHVWLVNLDAPDVDEAWCNRVLSAEERDRAGRFGLPCDRRRYIVSHAALRSVLASQLAVPPEQLEFFRRPGGKPALMPSADGPLAEFNLSHSDGLALIAVTRERQIGVDLERIREDVAFAEVAERFFSAREIAALMALPPRLQRLAFFHCWTAKEALSKARGAGLDGTPSDVDIAWTPDVVRIRPTSRDWTLLPLNPAQGYVGAVAMEGERVEIELLSAALDAGARWRQPIAMGR